MYTLNLSITAKGNVLNDKNAWLKTLANYVALDKVEGAKVNFIINTILGVDDSGIIELPDEMAILLDKVVGGIINPIL